MPLLWFFVPPPHAESVKPGGAKEEVTPQELINLLFYRGWLELHERLSELPEGWNAAGEAQAGVLDHFVMEAIGGTDTIQQTLYDVIDRLNDLAERYLDARHRAAHRIRRGLSEKEES